VDGALPRGIKAGLIRHQANMTLGVGSRTGWRLQPIETMLRDDIDSALNRAVTRAYAARRTEGLVVTGDALPPECFLLACRQVQPRSPIRRDLDAQPDRVPFPARMHGVRQQDDVALGRRIDPQ